MKTRLNLQNKIAVFCFCGTRVDISSAFFLSRLRVPQFQVLTFPDAACSNGGSLPQCKR